jgi:hypothetical protein
VSGRVVRQQPPHHTDIGLRSARASPAPFGHRFCASRRLIFSVRSSDRFISRSNSARIHALSLRRSSSCLCNESELAVSTSMT